MILYPTGNADVRVVADYINARIDEMVHYDTAWDLSACNVKGVGYADWKWLLEHTQEAGHLGRHRRAAVACGTTLQYGIGRMIEQVCEVRGYPVPVRAFRGLDPALAWLESKPAEPPE